MRESTQVRLHHNTLFFALAFLGIFALSTIVALFERGAGADLGGIVGSWIASFLILLFLAAFVFAAIAAGKHVRRVKHEENRKEKHGFHRGHRRR